MADERRVGDAVRLQNTFSVRDSGGTYVATDPTAVTLQVQKPGGTTTLYTYSLAEINRSATGVFYKDITFDEAGWWTYEWAGTGACIAVEGNKILVKAQLI